jgi:hypothetical protein
VEVDRSIVRTARDFVVIACAVAICVNQAFAVAIQSGRWECARTVVLDRISIVIASSGIGAPDGAVIANAITVQI